MAWGAGATSIIAPWKLQSVQPLLLLFITRDGQGPAMLMLSCQSESSAGHRQHAEGLGT
jgi:hypothetical protein